MFSLYKKIGFLFCVLFLSVVAKAQQPYVLSSGWMLSDSAKIQQTGSDISSLHFHTDNWYKATVPGTVLTSLVNDKVYPEPLYGENNRPDKISDSLCRTSYWYRTVFITPENYTGKQIWLNFDGINYAAQVWVNGHQVGEIKGAFARGIFDVTKFVKPGKKAVLAVLVSPQPHPGVPEEQTIKNGVGSNGGISAIDGPTFLCSMGWDWIPAIRDRNTGIWQKVFLSASGAVQIQNPYITTDVSIPDLKTADVHIETTLSNTSNATQTGILKGTFGNVSFEKKITVEGDANKLIVFNSADFSQLHLINPKLWWPNGFGAQNLYHLTLSFTINGKTSDVYQTDFGVRKITYSVPDADNLTVSVNGVKVMCKGGDWGMDEAMKRIPKARLETQIRMHALANYTMIRNWVGQSTSEDFYDLCDKYGIMLWDEFFQPNPGDGPNPTDTALYLANVKEKILRFRNHPSIAIWCGRNEGYPPKNIDSALRKMMKILDPARLYQPSSTAGRGVNSGGPYHWQPPANYYNFGEAFKTEIGSVSVPTLQSVHDMMPQKDWEVINDDWAEHDFANGAQDGLGYRKMLGKRYGKVINLADFVRKAQLANYEAFRALYEGRNAKLFAPCTGVLTWMSNPAQPSFVWQIYSHDLEPNASLFAAKEACEPVHIQLNEKTHEVQVINNLPNAIKGNAYLQVYNLDSKQIYTQQFAVNALPSAAITLDSVNWLKPLPDVFFVKLELKDNDGKLLSDNFYWQANKTHPNDLTSLNQLPFATLNLTVKRTDENGKCLLKVTVHNNSKSIALMAHLQLHGQKSDKRILPVFYSGNYISLIPNESRTVTIEADLKDLHGEKPLIKVDGWNVGVKPFENATVAVELNKESQVSSWAKTGLPIDYGVAEK
ncbi:glycoside hydrolase [Arachidicoccus ginsenosidimutans]|nr:glycoside hydrolase [Arachidicoccus sp. BS20]